MHRQVYKAEDGGDYGQDAPTSALKLLQTDPRPQDEGSLKTRTAWPEQTDGRRISCVKTKTALNGTINRINQLDIASKQTTAPISVRAALKHMKKFESLEEVEDASGAFVIKALAARRATTTAEKARGSSS